MIYLGYAFEFSNNSFQKSCLNLPIVLKIIPMLSKFSPRPFGHRALNYRLEIISALSGCLQSIDKCPATKGSGGQDCSKLFPHKSALFNEIHVNVLIKRKQLYL